MVELQQIVWMLSTAQRTFAWGLFATIVMAPAEFPPEWTTCDVGTSALHLLEVSSSLGEHTIFA